MKTRILFFIALMIIGVTAISQLPEFWYLDEVNPGMDITLYADGSNPHDGTFACKITLEQPEVPYLISDNFDVTAGDAYTFTIWYFDNDSRGSLKFYADFYDAEGNDIYGEDPLYSEDADMWQSVTWSSIVPNGAVEGYILVKFYDDDGYVDEAIAWVDHASFEVNSENLVLNGSFESWPGVGVTENLSHNMEVYPNPASDLVNVGFDGIATSVEILNTLGQVELSVELNQEIRQISLSNFESGIYFIRVLNQNEQIALQKLIKK